VIFGKHIDKFDMDKKLGIHTLPVILGEKFSRYTALGMIFLQYILVVYLVLSGFFTPLMLIVFFSITVLLQIIPMFRNPKPEEKPEDYPDVWPNYFVAGAFVHNRRFGLLFLLGLILDTVAVYVMRNFL
jgi:1,4-dihydroxy-2-naphthoate octaprenyltransferase